LYGGPFETVIEYRDLPRDLLAPLALIVVITRFRQQPAWRRH
jgi:hypothetical protein